MREILVSVTLVCLITSLALMIMPEGGLKKYVKLSISLSFIAFTVSQFGNGAIGDISLPYVEIKDRSDEFYASVIEEAKENAINSLKSAIGQKFNVSKNDIELDLTLEDTENGLVISDVYIKLFGIKNTVKVTAVKKYIEELLGCRVTAGSSE